MNDRFCIVGAGPAGLSAAHAFRRLGLAIDVLERESDIGGVWNFDTPGGRVHASTRMISSRRKSEFRSFPLPKQGAAFPDHRELMQNLRDFSKFSGADDVVTFGADVTRVAHDSGGWLVQVEGEPSPRRYRGAILCTGHHRIAHLPSWATPLTSGIMHSCDYKNLDQIRGKRVLVVGSGNSGCDISVAALDAAQSVDHSMRNGVHIFPRVILGMPIDEAYSQLDSWMLPHGLREWLYESLVTIAFGSPRRFGLPRPVAGVLSRHPTINEDFPRLVRSGKIRLRGDVGKIADMQATFADGTTAGYDVVVLATGYETALPFPVHVDDRIITDTSDFLMKLIHPDWNELYAIGYFQTNGGYWPLMDWQAHIAASLARLGMAGEGAALETARREVQSASQRYENDVRGEAQSDGLAINYTCYKKNLKGLAARLWTLASTPQWPASRPEVHGRR